MIYLQLRFSRVSLIVARRPAEERREGEKNERERESTADNETNRVGVIYRALIHRYLVRGTRRFFTDKLPVDRGNSSNTWVSARCAIFLLREPRGKNSRHVSGRGKREEKEEERGDEGTA